jgi:cysteinyl-tRNA synthetase
MGLRLHNTLTRTKEDFVPIDPANIRMYVCGPTVYDFAHIGNARPLIVFDVLFRLLRHLYGTDHVTYVRNITDVDDKIIARAAEEYSDLPLNEAIRKVTEKTETQFHEDVAALGCLPPTVEPRATQHIEEMKAMIEELIAKGFAYVGEGHVLFRVSAMADYGRLSNRTLDEMVAGARVEIAPYKQDPMDFVLWKPSKPGEPAWPSPVGIATPGRPGWHLECSAMSDRWLWEDVKDRLSPAGLAHPHEFDIHGGGLDLIFPHHENEIAQSRCAHGTPLMARYWLHNGFLQVEGEKMSKSLGNFVTIRDVLKRVYGGVLRFVMLQTQYRQPLDWTEVAVQKARYELGEWAELSASFPRTDASAPIDADVADALCDDINTPQAITRLRELYKLSSEDPDKWLSTFRAAAALLGLGGLDKPGYFRSAIAYYAPEGREEAASQANTLAIFARMASANNLPVLEQIVREIRSTGAVPEFQSDGDVRISFPEGSVEEVIREKIAARAAARKEKNFAEADRIRAELDAMGIALKDSKDPATGELKTTWEVKR